MGEPITTAQLTIVPDALLYPEGDKQHTVSESRLLDNIQALQKFVTERIAGRGPAEYVETASGSYNVILRFKFAAGTDVALRIPKLEHSFSPLILERINNEVAWMQLLKKQTHIPIPKLYSYGTKVSPETPLPLDLPYILMEFIEGKSPQRFLAERPKPGQDEDVKKKRFTIYEQIAEIYLELYHLKFKAIGSPTNDQIIAQWDITKPPLTMDMCQQTSGLESFSTNGWFNKPLLHSKDYFDMIVDQQRNQLWTQRNLNIPREMNAEGWLTQLKFGDDIDWEQAAKIARLRFRARKGFARLVPKFCTSGDSFVPFSPDFHPRNVLVNQNTDQVTGVIDWEYTNAMPAQFASDPPLWLLGMLPEQCLERNLFPWYRRTYPDCLIEFLDAMKSVEDRKGKVEDGSEPLSDLMRKSWESGQCLFNYAANNLDLVDAIMIGAFPESCLEPQSPEEEQYVTHSRQQIKSYEAAWAAARPKQMEPCRQK